LLKENYSLTETNTDATNLVLQWWVYY